MIGSTTEAEDFAHDTGPLTEDEERLFGFLKRLASGYEHAIPSASIFEHIGMKYDRIQKAAQGLVWKGQPLGSCQDGLFICRSDADFTVAFKMLDHYIWPTLKRKRALSLTQQKRREEEEKKRLYPQGNLFDAMEKAQ